MVQGEASETDSDDEVYITSLSTPQTTSVGAKVRSVGEGERGGVYVCQ